MLNRDKPAARKRKVLFIDGSGEFEEGSNQNRLRDEDIQHIASTFHAYADVEKYARVVPLGEIEQNDWNLNISRYVHAHRVRRLHRRRHHGDSGVFRRQPAAADPRLRRFTPPPGEHHGS